MGMTQDSSVWVNGGSSLYCWKISTFLSNSTANIFPANKVSVKPLCVTHCDGAGPRQAHGEQGHANHIRQSVKIPQTSPGKPQTGILIIFSITTLPQVKQLDSHPYSCVASREYCPMQPFPVAICRALHSSSYGTQYWDADINSCSLHTPLLLTDNHSRQHRNPAVEICIYNRVWFFLTQNNKIANRGYAWQVEMPAMRAVHGKKKRDVSPVLQTCISGSPHQVWRMWRWREI